MMTPTLRWGFGTNESTHKHEYFSISLQSTVFHSVIINFNELLIQSRLLPCPSFYLFWIFTNILSLGVILKLIVLIILIDFFKLYLLVLILFVSLLIDKRVETEIVRVEKRLGFIEKLRLHLRNILRVYRDIDRIPILHLSLKIILDISSFVSQIDIIDGRNFIEVIIIFYVISIVNDVFVVNHGLKIIYIVRV